MGSWARRTLYLLAVAIWLMIMSIPLLSFTLAMRNQVQMGSSTGTHMRLFLIQERESEGIGLETARKVSQAPTCLETNVRYFMWLGTPENVQFCHCVDSTSGETLSRTQGTCP